MKTKNEFQKQFPELAIKQNKRSALPDELLRLLDKLTYFNHVTLSTINKERIKIAEQGKQETTNDLTEYYLNNY
jgi:hypothetical protein